MRKYLAIGGLVVLLVLGAVRPSYATDGDLVACRTAGDHETCVYTMIDARTTTDAGTAVWVGAFEALTFWPVTGVDGSNTWSVDCAVNGDKDTTPSVWFTVQAATSDTTAKRMQVGDTCEWVRIPLDTSDATAVTVRMQVVRSRER